VAAPRAVRGATLGQPGGERDSRSEARARAGRARRQRCSVARPRGP
jgi:hypothetical protein